MPSDVAEASTTVVATPDRRRPGRPAQVAPELVGLLRWHPGPAHQQAFYHDDTGNRPAEGLFLGLLCGGAVWIGLILTTRLLLG